MHAYVAHFVRCPQPAVWWCSRGPRRNWKDRDDQRSGQSFRHPVCGVQLLGPIGLPCYGKILQGSGKVSGKIGSSVNFLHKIK